MAYDLVVIGAGAAGLGAARAAARRGSRTLLVADGEPGGDCTFTGCVPSKTLIESAAAGITFGQAAARVRAAIERIAATETAEVLRGEGIDVVRGRARLGAAGRVEVADRAVEARRVVLATGSRPAEPAVPDLSAVSYLTNETVFDLAQAPASLAILGGGAIGCELAQAFARFGVRVAVIESADRLLPAADPRASAVLAARFAAEGIAVHTGQPAARVDRDELRLADGTRIPAARLLVATGRRPGTDELGLAEAGIAVDSRGFVRTDVRLATTAAGVYAAGDVTGRMLSTHAADAMGRLAATNALSRRQAGFDTRVIPHVVFTDPEIAQVGVTEQQAAGSSARAAYLPMSEVDRAISAGRTEGFVALIAGPRRLLGRVGGGRVLGATIVAPRAGEMIAEITLAMRTGAFTGRLAQTTHAYPTWSHAVQLAAAQLFGHGHRRPRAARAAPPPEELATPAGGSAPDIAEVD